ncbi:MAG: cysteine--tRNA ligase [Pseudomonadota bacterium]
MSDARPLIRLYDTASREKRVFEPIDPSNLRMYVCGPTVYDRAHIGNARPVIVFDVLFRLLRHAYGGDHVTYVRNLTDVDDKINKRAAERGVPISTVTEETIDWFHQDMDALGAMRPTHEPRATKYIDEMIALIAKLIADDKAYAAEGHALFSVSSFNDYGALSRRSIDDMIAGARVEVAPYKRDPMDFVLWKPSSGDEPGWESPWGYGRPGWHIECSAMADALLGQDFDIHGGGIDLTFPHHENERAQSLCAHPGSTFANYWMHNGYVQVEGEKMSKSLGNFITVHDLRSTTPGDVIRYVLLNTHYRKPLDWTSARVEEAQVAMNRLSHLNDRARREKVEWGQGSVSNYVLEPLYDDLDTASSLKRLGDLAKDHSAVIDVEHLKQVMATASWMGFRFRGKSGPDVRFTVEEAFQESQSIDERIDELCKLIDKARREKRFDDADRTRAELQAAGVEVRSSKEGTSGSRNASFDASKLPEIPK